MFGPITCHLLTESEVITGKSQTKALVSRSIHQGRGLRFPCNDQTDEFNKLFTDMALLALFLKRIQ